MRLAKYGAIKALVFGVLGGIIGLYFRNALGVGFRNLMSHQLLFPALMGAILGYTLNNTLDLGAFTFFFPKNTSTSDCKNILVDFFSCLNLCSNEEEGYYASVADIIEVLKEERGNIYKAWEVLEFLEKQPYKIKQNGKYFEFFSILIHTPAP